MMETERLLKLADFIEEVVPENRFDMHHFLGTNDDFPEEDIHPDQLEAECGTSACAAGWATLLFKKEGLKLAQEPYGQMWNPAFEEYEGYDALSIFFNIDITDASCIFGSNPRTTKEEADLIRRYVAEGSLEFMY